MKDNNGNNSVYFLMTTVFTVLALVFIFTGGNDFKAEKNSVTVVDAEFFTKMPVRYSFKDAKIKHSSFTYQCNECHQNFETSGDKRKLNSHRHIQMNHGVVESCFKCHSPSNRERLLDLNKNEILFSQSAKNCYQCHGPIYRDWKEGIHGRMGNYWDKSKGATGRLLCVECHNPHSPKFQSMIPAPAPHTDGSVKDHHK